MVPWNYLNASSAAEYLFRLDKSKPSRINILNGNKELAAMKALVLEEEM